MEAATGTLSASSVSTNYISYNSGDMRINSSGKISINGSASGVQFAANQLRSNGNVCSFSRSSGVNFSSYSKVYSFGGSTYTGSSGSKTVSYSFIAYLQINGTAIAPDDGAKVIVTYTIDGTTTKKVTFIYNGTLGSFGTSSVSGTYTKDLTNGTAYSTPTISADTATLTGYTASTGSESFTTDSETNADNSYTVAIGTSSTAYYGTTVIGCGSDSGSKKLLLGADNIPYCYMSQPGSTWTSASDKRDKADFEDITKSLNFINQLKPVTFVDNHRDKYRITKLSDEYDENGNQIEIEEFNEEAYNNQSLKGHRRIAGFIAQDVYKTLNETYNDDNYASIVDYSKYDGPDNEVDRYYMRYTQLIPFLTGAIQELSKEIDALKATIAELNSQSINQ